MALIAPICVSIIILKQARWLRSYIWRFDISLHWWSGYKSIRDPKLYEKYNSWDL